MDMLWYAVYGSKINRDHFLEYIRGGKSAFNGKLSAALQEAGLNELYRFRLGKIELQKI